MRTLLAWLTTALLGLSAALHLYFGAMFAIDPEPFLTNLSLEATAPAGLAEMRAFYGGLMLALGALFLIAGLNLRWRYAGLVLMTVTYLAAGSMRTLSIVSGAIYDDPLLLQLLAIEGIGGVLGAVCWLGMPRGDRAQLGRRF